jgi:glycine/serine hydroxymethyltransferase
LPTKLDFDESNDPLCFGRHVKPFVPAVFAIVSTHQSALGPRGGLLLFLWVIHKEGLCRSSGDINGLMMMMMMNDSFAD